MTRAAVRTAELTAPPVSRVGEEARRQLRDRLLSRVSASIAGLPPGGQVEVTLPLLRRALVHPDRPAMDEEPFAWKPVFVRRSLGLAVVSACVTGRFRGPSEAVVPIATDAVAEWERTGWRTFHWEPWFSGLPSGARAVVLADAVGWATSLWTAFDWTAFAQVPQIGGADDHWTCPAPRTVRLKGRSEMRVPLTAPGSVPRGRQWSDTSVALVSVSGGCPEQGWAEGLAYLALTAGLRSSSLPVPARVMGLWPDAGIHRTVDVDERALEAAADRVARTVGVVVGARVSTAPPG